MDMESDGLTLEEIFKSLDGVIGEMQRPDLSLEETFARYKEGVELTKKAGEKIEKIECDIKLINGDE